MGSALGWIDFSSDHRKKVTNVINLLSAPGTVDELGIGIIRNAFSNRLFPGLSTVQTRAKYFIIIPRILRQYDALPDGEKRKYPSLANYLEQQEHECNKILVSKNKGEFGIFGADNVGQNKLLQRMPSSVYWNGLRTFALIDTQLSKSDFLMDYQRRTGNDGYHHYSNQTERGDDHDAGDQLAQSVKIPDANNDWKEDLSIHLTAIEAEYLQDAIVEKARGSLLAYFLGEEKREENRIEEFLRIQDNDFRSLLSLDCIKELPGKDNELFQTVQAATDFWQVMLGAHIRYNQLLQNRNSEGSGTFDQKWQKWHEEIHADTGLWSRWNTAWLWELVRKNGSVLKDSTRSFVERWSQAIQEGNARKLDTIVIDQEKLNKGEQRARLRAGGERVKEGEWVGIGDLSYRLPTARRIIGDIRNGLRQGVVT